MGIQLQMRSWFVVYLPLWKKKLVSWDDYFQYMEKEKMFQTTNQDRIINSMLDSDGVCVLKWSSDWKWIINDISGRKPRRTTASEKVTEGKPQVHLQVFCLSTAIFAGEHDLK